MTVSGAIGAASPRQEWFETAAGANIVKSYDGCHMKQLGISYN